MPVHRRTLRKIKDLTVGDTTVVLNSVQRRAAIHHGVNEGFGALAREGD